MKQGFQIIQGKRYRWAVKDNVIYLENKARPTGLSGDIVLFHTGMGTVEFVGPWLSNPEAFKEDTGSDPKN